MAGKYGRISGAQLMVTKLGFGRGPVTTPEEKYARIAILSASLLTLVAVSCGSLGLWRVSVDPGWTGNFAIRNGLLSHWQVWISAAVGIQYTSWWLVRYAGTLRRREVEIASAA
jgi:hypothetical protein